MLSAGARSTRHNVVLKIIFNLQQKEIIHVVFCSRHFLAGLYLYASRAGRAQVPLDM
jgi:hypothetical protein